MQQTFMLPLKSFFNKNHYQKLLQKCSYRKFIERYIMREFNFLKVLLLMKQGHLKIVLFGIIDIF